MTPELSIRTFSNDQYYLDKAFYTNHYRVRGVKENGPVVLDIGAHCGYFTFSALALGASEVIAVEINPENYKMLLKNTSHYTMDGKVKTFNFGIYTTVNTIPFTFGGGGMKDNLYFDHAEIDVKKTDFTIPVMSLDVFMNTYVKKNVDILKLNIGYAELEIIEGCTVANKMFNNIVLETSDSPDRINQFLLTMKERGFADSLFRRVEEEEKTLLILSKGKCSDTFNVD
jgi:FkbM family methyltransferase